MCPIYIFSVRNFCSDVGRLSTYVKIILTLSFYSICILIGPLVLLDLFLSSFLFMNSVFQMFVMYVFMLIFDIYFVIASSYFFLKLGKSHEMSEKNIDFNMRRNGFGCSLDCSELWFTWPLEIFNWQEDNHSVFALSLISDITKIFTAINLFVIFVLRESVKQLIFRKYRIFKGFYFLFIYTFINQ